MLGHFGETLPFLLWRIDAALARPGQKPMSFRGIFSNNFYVTTSGFFSDPALLCRSWRWASTTSCSRSTGRS